MHALLIGGTGATGNDLLKLLLLDEAFTKVDIFVRRQIDLEHKKLQVHLIDFDRPEEWKSLVKGDVLFSCLGTTLKKAGSKEAQWKIDYEYQYQFAKSARENNVPSYILVSADSASPDSIFFYSRMKGRLELAVKELNFPRLVIFRPPILIRKSTDRTVEVIGIKILKFFNKLGMFKIQTPLPTELLAEAMVNISKTKTNGFSKLRRVKILQWARSEI